MNDETDESAKYVKDCYELLLKMGIIDSKYQFSIQFLGKSKDFYSVMICRKRRASNDLLHQLNEKMTQITECFKDERLKPLLQQGRKILNKRVELLTKKYKITIS